MFLEGHLVLMSEHRDTSTVGPQCCFLAVVQNELFLPSLAFSPVLAKLLQCEYLQKSET